MSRTACGLVSGGEGDAVPADVVEWTTGDLLRRIVETCPDRPALVIPGPDGFAAGGRQWTYRQFEHEARQVALFLQDRFEPGDPIGVWASNRPEWMFVQFGVALAGMCLVAINPACRTDELRHALQTARVVGLFYGRRYRDIDADVQLAAVAADAPHLRFRLAFEDWPMVAGSSPAEGNLPRVSPASPAMVQFTSGTTGKPKAAVLSHRGLVNVAQFSERRFGLATGSVWLNWLPLFHTGSCVWAVMSCMWNKGALVLLPSFDAGLVLQCVETYAVRWLPSVQTATMSLLEHPGFQAFDLSSLEVVTQGGAPIPPELVGRMERAFGAEYVMVFGQTETSSCVSLSLRGDTEVHKSRTVGLPLPHTEVRIVDPTTGQPAAPGEAGEICVRSYATLIEYFGDPEATRAVVSPEGWLATGDVGTLEADGYLTITGRLKDVVIRGGENIYPREIEDVLAEYPGMGATAVFGVPDAVWGETLVAALYPASGSEMDVAEVRSFLLSRLARHKVPAAFWLVTDLPLTTSGKIQKFALRDLYLQRGPGKARDAGASA